GATENAMLAAVCAAGTTTITNAAREPEIADLQGFLRAIGAKVHGAGSSVITVEGGVPLHGGSYAVMGDRIVAATYLAAAASAGGTVEVTGVDYRHLSTVSAVLREAGCDVQSGAESIRLRRDGPLQGCGRCARPPTPA
ncbi:UDP-N-acetylglucosamine 1-carboxyvinyltransferase, partial [Flavonifractor plautii]|nr:UDP-N-acetylglucosamine 1-carboxyvinyltransferase [Flavonifractor plautii]